VVQIKVKLSQQERDRYSADANATTLRSAKITRQYLAAVCSSQCAITGRDAEHASAPEKLKFF